MYIDTHCHLNFKAFEGGAAKIIARAQKAGVSTMVIPGTDCPTSELAVSIATHHPQSTYALVGIHPHHAAHYAQGFTDEHIEADLSRIAQWLSLDQVVGVGEVGLDRHTYTVSKYGASQTVSESLFTLQKKLFTRQVRLAVEAQKALTIHNREAATDFLSLCAHELASDIQALAYKAVLHCCEPDAQLLAFARLHHFYIGIDGDVTYDGAKQSFIQAVPLELLVLETDAPYILPEPFKSMRKYPNLPEHLPLIAQKVAQLKGLSLDTVAQVTTDNAKRLFGIA